MAANQFALLRQRRFLPFFLTQALGAFNDNVFRSALVILIAFKAAELSSAAINFWSNLAAALFILPFFLFSAIAGQWAEKFEKSRSIRRIITPTRSVAFARRFRGWCGREQQHGNSPTASAARGFAGATRSL